MKILGIAVAGAIGSLARYGLQGLIQGIGKNSAFPWGTVVVNLLGCLVFGLCISFFDRQSFFRSEWKTIVCVGFLGAFTTFSTYMFETSNLLDDGEWWLASGYFLLHNVVGWFAMIGGLAAGKWIC